MTRITNSGLNNKQKDITVMVMTMFVMSKLSYCNTSLLIYIENIAVYYCKSAVLETGLSIVWPGFLSALFWLCEFRNTGCMKILSSKLCRSLPEMLSLATSIFTLKQHVQIQKPFTH